MTELMLIVDMIKNGTEQDNEGREMKKTSSTFKDVVELNGNWYTLHLTINEDTGEVIDSETWVE